MEDDEPIPGTMTCDNCGYPVNQVHRVIHVGEEMGVCNFCFEANPNAYDAILGTEYDSGAPAPREFDWEGLREEPPPDPSA